MHNGNAFHGGAFWQALGHGFEHLDRRPEIISADVLDAWFPPSPSVVEALSDGVAWMCQTSPPVSSEGLRAAISNWRGIPRENLVLGAGSSDLIFRTFLHLLGSDSKVLILNPTYGEYAHVLENVVGCEVGRFELPAVDSYRVDPTSLIKAAKSERFDMIVLVNPNSPTGQHVSRQDLLNILAEVPRETLVWLDEAYIDYVGPEESLESLAGHCPNLIVCKTMSKAYALSGLRVAYLAAAPSLAARINRITPPWNISLPAQLAACAALGDPEYYRLRYSETHAQRGELALGLREIGRRVLDGAANSILWMPDGPAQCAAEIIAKCSKRGLFLRDTRSMGTNGECIRVAVKDADTNGRMLDILREVVACGGRNHRIELI